MKPETKKKTKAVIGLSTCWLLTLLCAAIIYLLCIWPFFKGTDAYVWGILLVMPWIYGSQHLFITATKRYTNWWNTLSKK